MFGGFGFYSADLFFGIVHQDILYFKVNDQSRDDYVRTGMAPFKPYKDRPITMQYYQVPAAVIENAQELCQWAEKAIAAARDKKKPAGKERRRKPSRR